MPFSASSSSPSFCPEVVSVLKAVTVGSSLRLVVVEEVPDEEVDEEVPVFVPLSVVVVLDPEPEPEPVPVLGFAPVSVYGFWNWKAPISAMEERVTPF